MRTTLEEVESKGDSASVASFEYGINETIPHSRGGELLCPGNNISEGIVSLDRKEDDGDPGGFFIGLNNGNGRGTIDTIWGASLGEH